MDQQYKFHNMIKKKGNDTKLLPSTETVGENSSLQDIYCQRIENNEVSNEAVERSLVPIWSQITYIRRSIKSATIGVQFENASIAKEIFTRTLKIEEIIL